MLLKLPVFLTFRVPKLLRRLVTVSWRLIVPLKSRALISTESNRRLKVKQRYRKVPRSTFGRLRVKRFPRVTVPMTF